MGKTKTVIIDDSQPKKEEDSLVAKLREELGMVQKDSENSDSQKIKEPEGSEMSVGPRAKQKPTKPSKSRSQKYLEASKGLDRSKFYPLSEALDMVKKMSYSKFNGTLEAHINTLQTGLRGFTSLPFASGKKLKILVFAKAGEDFSGAISGNDSTISEIEKGKIDFDLIIATPEWMPVLAKVAKVLGPRGLMPNPKNETITDDPKKAIEGFLAGKVEFKTEIKAPVIHISLGKLTQPNEELEANIKIILSTLGKTKIKKITLSPTMGPGVKLDLGSI